MLSLCRPGHPRKWHSGNNLGFVKHFAPEAWRHSSLTTRTVFSKLTTIVASRDMVALIRVASWASLYCKVFTLCCFLYSSFCSQELTSFYSVVIEKGNKLTSLLIVHQFQQVNTSILNMPIVAGTSAPLNETWLKCLIVYFCTEASLFMYAHACVPYPHLSPP